MPPLQAGVLGLARAADVEMQGVGVRVGTADLDPDAVTGPGGIPQALADLVGLLGAHDEGATGRGDALFEAEVAVRDGGMLVPRLTKSALPCRGAVEVYVDEEAKDKDGDVQRMTERARVKTRAQSVVKLRETALGPEEVEVRVRAVGLKLVDLQTGGKGEGGGSASAFCSSGVPLEFSGRVTRVGADVARVRVGEDVFGIAVGALKTYARVDQQLVARKPSHLTHEEASTLPVAMVTAEHAVGDLVEVKEGVSAGALCAEFLNRPRRFAELMDRFFSKDVLTLRPSPMQVFDVLKSDEECRAAFRFEHRASLSLSKGAAARAVLSFPSAIMAPVMTGNGNDSLPSSIAHRPEECVYIVTGGRGGLGPVVANWLLDEGASKIVLVSRSEVTAGGSEGPEMVRLRRAAAEGAVSLDTRSCDVSDFESCYGLLQAVVGCGSEGVRFGIVHAAGVLSAGLVENQNEEGVRRVFGPKVLGAWNLHRSLQRLGVEGRLETFVLFSSVASLFGTKGNANYAAANSALDAFASFRARKGMRAVSIQWGGWREQGMAAGVKLPEGLVGLSNDVGLRVLFEAMRASIMSAPESGAHPLAVVGCQEVRWRRFLKRYGDSGRLPPGFFEDVQAAVRDAGGDDEGGERAKEGGMLSRLGESVEQISREALGEHVRAIVVEAALKVLGPSRSSFSSSSSSLPMDAPLQEVGIDSLGAMEFRNDLSSKLGVRLPVSALSGSVTLSGVTNLLLEKIRERGGGAAVGNRASWSQSERQGASGVSVKASAGAASSGASVENGTAALIESDGHRGPVRHDLSQPGGCGKLRGLLRAFLTHLPVWCKRRASAAPCRDFDPPPLEFVLLFYRPLDPKLFKESVAKVSSEHPVLLWRPRRVPGQQHECGGICWGSAVHTGGEEGGALQFRVVDSVTEFERQVQAAVRRSVCEGSGGACAMTLIRETNQVSIVCNPLAMDRTTIGCLSRAIAEKYDQLRRRKNGASGLRSPSDAKQEMNEIPAFLEWWESRRRCHGGSEGPLPPDCLVHTGSRQKECMGVQPDRLAWGLLSHLALSRSSRERVRFGPVFVGTRPPADVPLASLLLAAWMKVVCVQSRLHLVTITVEEEVDLRTTEGVPEKFHSIWGPLTALVPTRLEYDPSLSVIANAQRIHERRVEAQRAAQLGGGLDRAGIGGSSSSSSRRSGGWVFNLTAGRKTVEFPAWGAVLREVEAPGVNGSTEKVYDRDDRSLEFVLTHDSTGTGGGFVSFDIVFDSSLFNHAKVRKFGGGVLNCVSLFPSFVGGGREEEAGLEKH
uniref:Carrier domain-containing protein n=1 Tax=Chromera velia CCMP2878 TaxID=1169474 RepID=A0A0G4IAH8_9ALVE|eukprot:Cvel_12574.t1-p1 / transcript=Cvel_12574.t1 / gene=Cvel_12574 / organism=Chromera_velia_CCMP2878 / gene_product=Erythronolide synthase, modules 1 and 2, putative / transcript_product=Erythronolide synthase, modules 1 and 2, putative / location=Cvel_scaffold828:7519-12911(+) / protein_length=1290 / sequence_SO=supercontig / SO=protein_coding / is_pseudo=false